MEIAIIIKENKSNENWIECAFLQSVLKTTEEEKIEVNNIINALTVQFNLYGSKSNERNEIVAASLIQHDNAYIVGSIWKHRNRSLIDYYGN